MSRITTHRIAPRKLPDPPRAVPSPKSTKRRPVIVDGQRFPSLSEAARAYRVKRQTVHWWTQRKRKPRATYASEPQKLSTEKPRNPLTD